MTNWVIGSHGLLGSAVMDELVKSGDLWQPSSRIAWAESSDSDAIGRLKESINLAVEEFTRITVGKRWTIFWCAGIGVVNSPNELLELETLAVKFLLSSLERYGLKTYSHGKIFFSSSAGGVYAGSSNPPFSEATHVVPISNYGKQKSAIEQLLINFGQANNVKIVIGRIANLYGVKQNRHKQQGLVTSLVQSSLLNTTINLYVPLATVRNYIFAQDAACQIVSHVMEMNEPTRLAVICSRDNRSLSSILQTTEVVMKKRLRYFQTLREETVLQPIDLRLFTQSPPRYSEVPLVVGINNVRLHLLGNLQSGLLV